MYRIFKNNRPAGNLKFETYEAARQTVRKWLRRITLNRDSGQPVGPMALYGYEIRAI